MGNRTNISWSCLARKKVLARQPPITAAGERRAALILDRYIRVRPYLPPSFGVGGSCDFRQTDLEERVWSDCAALARSGHTLSPQAHNDSTSCFHPQLLSLVAIISCDQNNANNSG